MIGIHQLVLLEQFEAVLRCLEEHILNKTLDIEIWLKANRQFDPIRDAPRFLAAVSAMDGAEQGLESSCVSEPRSFPHPCRQPGGPEWVNELRVSLIVRLSAYFSE